MAYEHGIRVQENPTSLPKPLIGSSGLQVVIGTAPVNLTDNPYNKANEPFKVENYEQAVKYLGYSSDFKNYTLCQSISACFKVFAVSPVIFINVLDPKRHKKENTEETYIVKDGQAVVNIEGILLDTLIVKNGDTELIQDTDYVADFNSSGFAVINLINNNSVTELKVQSTSIDPTSVTVEDIIGGYNSETGYETGIQTVRKVYTKFNLVPNLLLAPGWSHIKEIGAALDAKSTINEVFTCENILDLDTIIATKYTDVEKLKEENGYTSEHSIVCWPKLEIDGEQYYFSALMGALISNLDAENGDIPSLSPSNKLLNVTGTVLEDGTEISLDVPLANTLNAIGVVTAVNDEGYRTWGNNMACYPANVDPKDRWIVCRRSFSWWGNRFIQTYKRKVDDPLNFRLIETLVDSENIFGNSLVSQGKFAGARMEYNVDDNPIESILDGHVIFKQYLAQYTPAESILNVLEFDPAMLKAALEGGGE